MVGKHEVEAEGGGKKGRYKGVVSVISNDEGKHGAPAQRPGRC